MILLGKGMILVKFYSAKSNNGNIMDVIFYFL